MQSNDALMAKQRSMLSKSPSPDENFGPGPETTVQAVYSARAAHMRSDRSLYKHLDGPIKSGTIDPVMISPQSKDGPEQVYEGHHRIVRAHQLGVSRLPVTFGGEETQGNRDSWLDKQVDHDMKKAGF